MSAVDDEIMAEAEDDARTVAFIRNYLPQELKEKFTDDDLYYFLDVIVDYYTTSGVLDAEPDADGFINIDEEKVAAYIADQAQKQKMGKFDPEDLIFVVEGEMEYAEQQGE
jgi:hypothetical protein